MEPVDISRYCQECLKFTQGNCKGKPQPKYSLTYWGQEIKGVLNSGLDFCERFEFDGQFFTFPKNSGGQVGTFKDIRRRQVKKQKADSNQEVADETEFAENLSMDDFEDLII